jgi:hypothetical protein
LADIYKVTCTFWCNEPVLARYARPITQCRCEDAQTFSCLLPMSMGHCFRKVATISTLLYAVSIYAELQHIRFIYTFFTQEIRQLKITFIPYVKDPTDVMPGITSTHLLFYKAIKASPDGTSRTFIFRVWITCTTSKTNIGLRLVVFGQLLVCFFVV